jgi:hypothetical protein
MPARFCSAWVFDAAWRAYADEAPSTTDQKKGGKMKSKTPAAGDERNEGFGVPAKLAQHKPGFDATVAKAAAEHSHERKAHRRVPKDPKDIPQTPLAQRFGDKGGK